MTMKVEARASNTIRASLLALAAAAICWSAAGAAGAANSSTAAKVFLHITRNEIVAGGHGFGSAGTLSFAKTRS